VSFTATGKKNRKVKLELKEAATLQQASSQMGMGHGRPVPSLSSHNFRPAAWPKLLKRLNLYSSFYSPD